jgi:HSP20 family protein
MLPTLRRPTRRRFLAEPADLMRTEFDRLFDELATTLPAEATNTGDYPVDIWEDENNIHVEAEMPGFRKDEIDVSLEHDRLSITAERKPEEVKGTSHLRERRYTRVQRQFTLPDTVDESNVDATFEDGVLKLTMTKRANAERRRIEVK